MLLEARLVEIATPVLGTRFYPDTSPDVLVFPFGVYQQTGGEALWFGESAVPDERNARVQIEVWARTRLEATTLMRQMEVALAAGLEVCRPIGALIALYEEQQKIYGARQDFTIWHNDSI